MPIGASVWIGNASTNSRKARTNPAAFDAEETKPAIGAIAPRSEPWRQPESGVVDMTPWRCELPQGLLTVGGLPPG
jgi:hypothetical protein